MAFAQGLWTTALPILNVLAFIATVTVNGLSGANDKCVGL
jgi:hypothetical protein